MIRNLLKIQTSLIFFTLVYFNSQCQVLKPAIWNFKVEKGEAGASDEIILKFIVQLDDTWQLYSTDQNPEVGPQPAEIDFEPHNSYELIGNVRVSGVKEKFDSVWLDNVRYLEGEGTFFQKVRILSEHPVIKGAIKYQLCTTVNGKCIYPEQDFSFTSIMINTRKGE